MRCVILASLVLGFAGPVVAAPCRVGIEERTVADPSRAYGGEPRPIRFVLWYPAATVSAGARAPGSGCASPDAAPRPGRYPLVLLGSGLSARPAFHAALAEALADAGFVVVFVTGLGPAPGEAPRFDADSVKMLAADAIRALDALAADPRVDLTRVGTVAWSVGSVVHLVVARDRPEIRAGVSLDGGVAYDYGPKLWADVSATPPRVIPYLHLGAGVRGPVRSDDSLIKALTARVRVIEGLSHAQFAEVAPVGPPEIERARASLRPAVVEFLQAQLAPPEK